LLFGGRLKRASGSVIRFHLAVIFVALVVALNGRRDRRNVVLLIVAIEEGLEVICFFKREELETDGFALTLLLQPIQWKVHLSKVCKSGEKKRKSSSRSMRSRRRNRKMSGIMKRRRRREREKEREGGRDGVREGVREGGKEEVVFVGHTNNELVRSVVPSAT